MRISSTSFSDGFLNQIGLLEQQQNTLQEQSSSGLKITTADQNPAVMAEVLNDQTASSANSQYQSNITNLQSSATTSASAMTSLQTIASRVSEIATQASSGTTSSTQLTSYATEVSSLLQEAVQIGNTQDADGNYIFGGTATSEPPFVATTDSSGNVTGVTYQGNSATAMSDVAPNVAVSANVPGANTSGVGAPGLFIDSSSGANLFSDMISLQQNLTSGNTAAISSTDVPALTTDDDNIIQHISANGVMQSTLSSASDIATSNSNNLTTQISNATGADLATTLTELDQTQTAYEAALESGTQIMGLSLLNFLQ